MIELSATYYDGKSSDGTPVTLRFEPGGPLRIEGLLEPLEVAADAVRVAPRLGDTVRSLRLPGGASCEAIDNDGVDALARALGQGRRSGWIHRLESHWRFALLALALVVAVVVVGIQLVIPKLAEHVARNVPEELAYDLGRGTLATLDEALFSPSQLPEDRRAGLARAFDGIASVFPDLPLRLEFRRAGFPNAFALPDGTVVVTDELVTLAERDEQVVSVLAHEVGHVHHRHSLRMALESSSVALLAGVVLGDATQLVAVASALPAVYANAHYSRSHEVEADTFALAYMDRSGLPRRHFADMLEALQRAVSGSREPGKSYLSSHPPTSDRVRRFRQ